MQAIRRRHVGLFTTVGLISTSDNGHRQHRAKLNVKQSIESVRAAAPSNRCKEHYSMQLQLCVTMPHCLICTLPTQHLSCSSQRRWQRWGNASWVASTAALPFARRPVLRSPWSLAVVWMDGRLPSLLGGGSWLCFKHPIVRCQVYGTDLRSSAVLTLSFTTSHLPPWATHQLFVRWMFRLWNKNVPRPDRTEPTLFRAETVPEMVPVLSLKQYIEHYAGVTGTSRWSNWLLFVWSNLWRAENQMQQRIASLRDELSKKDQALRSITGKVRRSTTNVFLVRTFHLMYLVKFHFHSVLVLLKLLFMHTCSKLR